MATKPNLRKIEPPKLSTVLRRPRFPRVTKCIAYPNRTKRRTFTAKDAGRVTCYALRDGSTVEELREELNKCAPCSDETRRTVETHEAASVAEQCGNFLLENGRTIAIALAAIIAVLIFMRAVGALLPRVALTALSFAPTLTRMSAMQVRFVAQKAANDSLFLRMRQFMRAANDAVFRRAAGG